MALSFLPGMDTEVLDEAIDLLAEDRGRADHRADHLADLQEMTLMTMMILRMKPMGKIARGRTRHKEMSADAGDSCERGD